MERLEPKWDNEKSYLQSRKENKVSFEENIVNMKIDMNNNLLMQKNENIKGM